MAASSLDNARVLVMFIVAALSSHSTLLAEGQSDNKESEIEGIRLVDRDGNIGGSQGRVEVMYNGQWGTVCGFTTPEAQVTCRMLGFKHALCAGGDFGHGNPSSPIWMDNVHCIGYESALDLCSFDGWGVVMENYEYFHICTHYDAAGVICQDESVAEQIGTPNNIRLIESTTVTLTIGWTAPAVPSWATDPDRTFTFQIFWQSEIKYDTQVYYNSSFINDTDIEMSYTIVSLRRDTQYRIQMRVSVRNSACNGYAYYNNGYYSDPVSFQTNAAPRQSNISVRLVSPSPGFHFLGRVEVFHDNQWGTVCDNKFNAACIICELLNFTQGAVCSIGDAQFGQGQGPIWLDYVKCRPQTDEILEDCDHSPWGNTSCSHHEDVGIICRPNTNDAYSAVQNLVVLSVSPLSITFGWSRYTFPPGAYNTGFQLQITRSDGSTFSKSTTSSNAPSSLTQYTWRNQPLGVNYCISVRASFKYPRCSYGYNSYIYGGYSNTVTAMTMETAPTAPPKYFYVATINRTAVEVKWSNPPYENSGGVILGYKLFVQSTNGGTEWTIDIEAENATYVYTVEELQPATSYRFSMLAYTSAGDGPRTRYLTAPTLRFDPGLITQFGYYGNDETRITRYLQSYSYYNYNSSDLHGKVHIHCASSNFTSAPPDWFFANGSTIGVRDSNFQVAYFPWNGTAVLKIADYRLLHYCDGGIFICRVVDSDSGQSEEKNFTLIIHNTPPSPGHPFLIKVQSTSITVGWSEATCDGGHAVKNFNIFYRHHNSTIDHYIYDSIKNIDPAQRNYTITGLHPDTYYSFRVQAVSWNVESSPLTPYVSATTLPPAPTPPYDVVARLVAPLMVEVRWMSPAVPNGNISQYYVYAIPMRSADIPTKGCHWQQSEPSNKPQVIQGAFSGSARAGNVTLVIHSINYQFRVSAAVSFNETDSEGDLSAVSANTSLFVPKPGLPTLTDPSIIESTNASITLMWNYPPQASGAIELFLVTHSGEVEWRSSKGFLVNFVDCGETNTTNSSVEISALIPGTTYTFKVSAITQSGRGAEVILSEATSDNVSLAYFQLRMGPVRSCFDFMDFTESNAEDLAQVRSGLVQELLHLCPTCGLTIANVKDDKFSCRCGLQLTKQIIYTARIVGTGVYSAPDLVSLMQSWVGNGMASIMFQSSRLHLDPTCDIELDSLSDTANCIDSHVTPTTAVDTTAVDTKTPVKGGVSRRQVGGITVGVAIGVLLAVI